jgi:hypothetical protein
MPQLQLSFGFLASILAGTALFGCAGADVSNHR